MIKQYITNVHLALEEEIVINSSLLIDQDGLIEAIGCNAPAQCQVINGNGGLLVPGAVDVHCDALEKLIETRPNVSMPQQYIMPQAEHLYASAGITTIYHSISFAGDESGKALRQPKRAQEIALDVKDWDKVGVIDHRLHARYEVGDADGLPVIKELIELDAVDMVSVMDHSPGQGQFPNFEKFFAYYGKAYNLSEEEARQLAETKKANAKSGWERAMDLFLCAVEAGIPAASHDDDSEDRVRFTQELGGSISEFPVNLETARCAHQAGLATIMGAPNIIRGGSQSGNIRALDVILDGVLDCLCADYVPWTLLASAFHLPSISECSLPQALQMVSRNPARAAGLDDRGILKVGMRADMALVHLVRDLPMVCSTWSAGVQAHHRQSSQVGTWDPDRLFHNMEAISQ
jgi:alpha-D-ribose 1-methylphosphonate 5-triphosphate diphosphatase